MSRARSHAEREAASHAVQELARGRSKESMAWDLVHRHDNELGHVNRRIGDLEISNASVREQLQGIRDGQREADVVAQQILTKIAHAEKVQTEQASTAEEMARYRRSLRNDWIRNLIALASLLLGLVATLLK